MVSGDKPGLTALPIEVEVELERARRLGDRFAGSCTEDSELAREQRARRFSAEFLKVPVLAHGLKNGDEIAKLEASLEVTRQTQLHAFLSADPAHEAPSRTSQLEKALRESLEDISVKSILDFRISGTGVPAAEATATAAVCAIANIDETAPVLSIHGLDPERPWADSLEVLSKPGHFINTLRRFPQASAKGAVPEENIVAARHFLQMAQSHRDAGHPALTSLGRWLAAAVELWEAQHLEEPRKAPAAPKAAARVHVVSHKPHDFRPLQRNEVRRPVVGANLATPRQPRLVQPSAKANSFGGRTVPLRPTSGVAPGPLDSSRPNGLSDSTRAAALRRSKSQDARQLRQSSPRPQVRERQQSPRVQRPETSPRPRQASPRPVATPQRSDRQSFCRAPVTARERPKERQPSPRPVGAVTAREDRQSLVRERPTCRDRSASRQIPSPSPKSEQLTRSQSARRSLDSRSPKTDPLNRSMSRGASQRSGTHLGLRGLVSSKSASTLARAPAATGPPNPTAELPSVEELKRMIEETKKEVREIRSVESKAKWQMTREERREKLAETVAAQSELREWRWKQAQGLKQLAAQQAQAAKVSDLKESKEFVEFKRETKLRSKEVELQHQQDVYVARKADAAWQVEQAKANVEKHQAQILEKVEDVHHLRQERRSQTENEKAVAAEERALQEHLQIANLARELAKEKERLLENLELTRACMQAPIRRR